MSTISIRSQVRRILGDQGQNFVVQQLGDGVTTRFDTSVENVDPEQFRVLIVGQGPLVAGRDYTMDFRFGTLILNVPPSTGVSVQASGLSYREFLPSDIDTFIRTAFVQHTTNRNPPLVLDAPDPDASTPPTLVLPEVEEKPLAIRAAIEALWDMATDAAQDIDITIPDGVNIPRAQRYSQIMQMIALQEERYDDICASLNVGLKRIEMFNLRRVSRTTNRLIPIYQAREMDDRTFPKRALPPIDQGATRLINYRGQYSPTTQYFVNDMVDEGGVVPTQRTTQTTAQVTLGFAGGLTIPVVSTAGFLPVGIIEIVTIANGVQQLSYTGLSTQGTAFINCSAGFGIAVSGATVSQAIGSSSARYICVAQPPLGTDPTQDVLNGTLQPDGSQAGHFWVTSTLNSAWMGQW